MSNLIPGLVSITLRQFSPEEIVTLCVESGLVGIEWGGDVHVPPGDLEAAQRVGFLTRARGLSVTAYGSYYRLGSGEDFSMIAETTAALGAPVIRVWAGNQASADADEAWRETVTADAKKIAQIAGEYELTVAFEYHGGTLTDSRESTRRLLAETTPVGLKTLWQPSVAWGDDEWIDSLEEVLPHLSHVHVFQWFPKHERRPLKDGEVRWSRFLKILKTLDRPVPLLLEFVENDDPANVRRDAETLISWIQ